MPGLPIPAAVTALRLGRWIDDRDWDALYPRWAARLSRAHWTPVAVARRAAALLVAQPGARVLDVGSGVGKLCLVGALTTGGIFTGVERRARLVQVAAALAHRGRVARCHFVADGFEALDFGAYDAFYLFNPFYENLPGSRFLPGEFARSRARYHGFVEAVKARLGEAPPGARVVTYHGLGGRLPPGWERVVSARLRGGPLTLWIKTAGRRVAAVTGAGARPPPPGRSDRPPASSPRV
jgi:SAM-dependent methyltransferase